jgi:hypothetical protein
MEQAALEVAPNEMGVVLVEHKELVDLQLSYAGGGCGDTIAF